MTTTDDPVSKIANDLISGKLEEANITSLITSLARVMRPERYKYHPYVYRNQVIDAVAVRLKSVLYEPPGQKRLVNRLGLNIVNDVQCDKCGSNPPVGEDGMYSRDMVGKKCKTCKITKSGLNGRYQLYPIEVTSTDFPHLNFKLEEYNGEQYLVVTSNCDDPIDIHNDLGGLIRRMKYRGLDHKVDFHIKTRRHTDPYQGITRPGVPFLLRTTASLLGLNRGAYFGRWSPI